MNFLRCSVNLVPVFKAILVIIIYQFIPSMKSIHYGYRSYAINTLWLPLLWTIFPCFDEWLHIFWLLDILSARAQVLCMNLMYYSSKTPQYGGKTSKLSHLHSISQSVIQLSFIHSSIQLFSYSVTQSFSHSVIQSFSYSVIQLYV